jgi:UPF0148 protein
MSDDKVVKMAEYLRKGATMLPYNCPVCNQPLFKVKGQIYCINCNKPVKIVKEGEEVKEQLTQQSNAGLMGLESEVMRKIQAVTNVLQSENDSYKIEQIGKQLIVWLDVLERIKRIKNI